MKKKLIVFLLSLGILLSSCLPVFAAEGKVYLNDYADLLSVEEKAEIEVLLSEISERQDFDIVIVTTMTTNGKSPMAYADDFYDTRSYGRGPNRDGCVLLISMAERDWWISTCGFGITALTDNGIQRIGSKMTSDLSDGDYEEAFTTYAETVDDFVTRAKDGRPYDNSFQPDTVTLAVSAIAAFVIALVIVLMIKRSYKPVALQRSAGNYLVSGSLALTDRYDHFLYTNVTKEQRDSGSSGGGSSTHTSSSGTSHGGGGGKF